MPVAYLAGLPVADAAPVLPVTNAAVRSPIGPAARIALRIGSSEAYKQWGAACFAELADALAEQGMIDIVRVGGKAEAPIAAEIAAAVSTASVTEAIGWRLSEIPAQCRLLRHHVDNDTGVMNIAGDRASGHDSVITDSENPWTRSCASRSMVW